MMSNDTGLDEMCGILPRTAEFLFAEMARMRMHGNKEYFLEISSLEVYCENVQDLYAESEQLGKSLNLITVKNKVVIQGQTWKKVKNSAQFLEYIKLSSNRRVFSSNGMNEHSSRSHHIFQIKINGQDSRYESFQSLLNIIDLAGSERRANMQPAPT